MKNCISIINNLLIFFLLFISFYNYGREHHHTFLLYLNESWSKIEGKNKINHIATIFTYEYSLKI